METNQQKIKDLQQKVEILTIELSDEIYSICESLDYHNCSRFSYNVDRLKEFNKHLQEFKIIEYGRQI
jgi:hypothetical protein